MRVEIRGEIFESVKEAAKHLRVNKITVYTALKRNRVDLVGTGAGRTKKAREAYGGQPGGRPARQVTVCGRTFESGRALSRWLGYDPRYYDTKRRRGQLDSVAAEVMKRLAAEEAKVRKELDKAMSQGIEKWHIMGGS